MSREMPKPIQRARVRIVLEHTFLASAVARLPLEPMPSWMPALAATDGYHIFIDTEELPKRSGEDIVFILLHEVMHAVLGHMDRQGERDPAAWGKAVDHATNLLLKQCGLAVPEDALCDDRFSGKSAERIYDELTKRARGRRAGSRGGTRKAEPGLRKGGLGKRVAEGHINPDDPRIAGTTQNPMLAPVERRRMRQSLVLPVRGKLRGTEAGVASEEIEAAESRQVPWTELLAQMITSLRRTDYRLYPFNKKHLWRGLYLPSVGEPGPEHIVLAVDTSASMDERELAVVLGEIDQLRGAAPCRITIVQADERVQRVESFEPHEPLPHEEPGKHFRFLGRGGTRFEPVFELVATEAFTEERGPPDALVYYTDGWADFPHRAPDYPVIWLITEDREHGASLRLPGRLRPRFGHIIPIAV